jgi:hypothetical protein
LTDGRKYVNSLALSIYQEKKMPGKSAFTMTKLTLCAAFAMTAFVGANVLETIYTPLHPSYFGQVILGNHLTKTHFPAASGVNAYSEYLRDRYLEYPESAYMDLSRLYGIKTYGPNKDKAAFAQFVNKWNTAAANKDDDNKSKSKEYYKSAHEFLLASSNEGEFDNKSALLMFLSLRAHNHEVYDLIDAIELCSKVITSEGLKKSSSNGTSPNAFTCE